MLEKPELGTHEFAEIVTKPVELSRYRAPFSGEKVFLSAFYKISSALSVSVTFFIVAASCKTENEGFLSRRARAMIIIGPLPLGGLPIPRV